MTFIHKALSHIHFPSRNLPNFDTTLRMCGSYSENIITELSNLFSSESKNVVKTWKRQNTMWKKMDSHSNSHPKTTVIEIYLHGHLHI